ncbi:hypothetical protein HKD37_U058892 [Glycine soja]
MCDTWQRVPRPNGFGRNHAQRLDGSRDSSTHTKYRFRHASSMQEPRYPLPESLFKVTSHNVWAANRLRRRIRTLHRTIQSVGATGGVYKGQGRSQRELMTRAY